MVAVPIQIVCAAAVAWYLPLAPFGSSVPVQAPAGEQGLVVPLSHSNPMLSEAGPPSGTFTPLGTSRSNWAALGAVPPPPPLGSGTDFAMSEERRVGKEGG